jgi:heterodisulfide reductase subunit A
MVTETFDMVVLSTGFKVAQDVVDMARIMGIDLTDQNFAKTGGFSPLATSREGIYAAGLFQGPKDIPETMVQASAAAGLAARHLGPRPETRPEDDLPAERDVVGEAPRIGVFICECGENIAGVIDAAQVAEDVRKLPGVVTAVLNGHGCSKEAMDRLERAIREQGLNRVVIGGCSPRTHETKFQDVLRRAGLNKYLVEMANLRDQDTWVHGRKRDEATAKAKDLVRMAVAGARSRGPLRDHTLPVNKDVLVVGGGVTGMTAALALADQGHRVFLVEREAKLGGLARLVRRTLEGLEVQPFVDELVEKTLAHEKIQVLTQTLVVDHTGMPGMFRTGLQTGTNMAYRRINHGAVVLATGALANRPSEYLLGTHSAVMTQLDLDNLLEDDPGRIQSMRDVVMIGCVGSRVPENPNCSRLCCQAAIKNALRIKAIRPEARVIVLNRDIRTYGFQEEYYRKARERGVIFVRYDLDRKPGVQADGDKILVTFRDDILQKDLAVRADLLALSTGLVSDDENTEDLSMIFKAPRTADGYFLEDHVKLRPVDLPVPGFLAAGAAHSPKPISECVAQGQAAAGRVLAMLAKDEINLGAQVARVDGKKCAACLICVRACPFGVPFINADGHSEIEPAKCHGCGVCAGECPAKAIELTQYEDDLILAKIDMLLEGLVMKGAR